MKGTDLKEVVGKLASIAIEAPMKLSNYEMKEEWTKITLIDPLLKALGWWDNPFEVFPEHSPAGVEDAIDYLFKPESRVACSICVEAKPLGSDPPGDPSHEQIKKGLEQTKTRGADYFIWTNGNVWQLFAVKLPNVPIYQVKISEAGKDESKIKETSDWLSCFSRDNVVNNPQHITEKIKEYWREMALPKAFTALLNELAEESIKLMRRVLPQELDISEGEIREFLKNCHWTGKEIRIPPPPPPPGPEEWEKLVKSREPKYQRARETLLIEPRRKLGEYLISSKYKPWRRTITFSLLGLPKRGSNTKGVTGPAVERYTYYGFIETVDPHVRSDEITYRRVDKAMPYLERLLKAGVSGEAED